jgi:cobyrinic acid a,c-diamide synthase
MSVPRLVVSGLEPGPAVALAAGALLACLGERRTVRPITVGLDLPLWQLLTASPGKTPRILDLALHDDETAIELYDSWAAGCDLALLVAVMPALDRWQDAPGSRAVDVAAALDAPLVLVVDARERGPTVAAAVYGVRALAPRAEIAGVIVVGGDELAAGAGLAQVLRRDVGATLLGWIPLGLSERFAGRYGAAQGRGGEGSVEDGVVSLCAEAGAHLQGEEIEAAATHRGFLPARSRKVLAPLPAATGLTLAVAWGSPLKPFGLENIDLLQAAGLDLAPFDVGRDRELPPNSSGLLLAGQLDEDWLPAVAGNRELLAALAEAVGDGLPTLAFGGGALLLLRRLADSQGRSHELAGVLPAEAELLEWYERPRYVRARPTRENPYDSGDNVLYELFDLEFLLLEQEGFAYHVDTVGGPGQAEGFILGGCLATTLCPSLPRCPAMAASFIAAMRLAGPRA